MNTPRAPHHPLPAQIRSRLRRAAATLHTLADRVPDELDASTCGLVGEVLDEEITETLLVLGTALSALDALGLRKAFEAATAPPSLSVVPSTASPEGAA